ncbi:MAG: transporter substrate-binding domain-containing protein [Curvibacter sp.]|nr:transporter substrate-binding domain-containing protein [Curvibacter sp.]
MKNHKLLFVSLLALGLASVSPGAWAQTALDSILKAKRIVIAVPPDFPPFGSMGPDFKLRGLDVDMANFVAAKLGVSAELIPVVSANRIPYLQKHKAALVIATLGKNPEREQQIDFSAAYSQFYQAVFGASNLNVKSFADLAGKSIGVTVGSVEEQELQKVAPAGTDIKHFGDNTKTVSAYIAGQVQLIATGASVAGDIMATNPDTHTAYKLLLKESPNYIGVPKGEDSLRLVVNGIIGEAKKNGDLDRMSMKWLGRPAGDLPQ